MTTNETIIVILSVAKNLKIESKRDISCLCTRTSEALAALANMTRF